MSHRPAVLTDLDRNDTRRSLRRWKTFSTWLMAALAILLTVVLVLGLRVRQPDDETFQPSPFKLGSTSTQNTTDIGNYGIVNVDPGGPYVPPSKLVQSDRFILDSDWDVNQSATLREYNLNLTYVTSDLDGYNRTVIAINNLFPGPIIRCNTGDTLKIKVINNLVEPTGIHWHGLYQRGTPWMDGVPGVSQCPIPVGEDFTYEFEVQDQWGTFWYHSHYGSQYNDGLFGPLIVTSPNEPHRDRYSGDILLIIGDWYHTFSNILTEAYLSATTGSQQSNLLTVPDRGCPEGDPCRESTPVTNYTEPAFPASLNEPQPDTALINGGNYWNCTEGCSGGRYKATVKPENTYRIRVINTGAFQPLIFSIDGHELQIIETDGNDVNTSFNYPQASQSLAVAQRYSFLLETSAPAGDYFIRARIQTSCAFSSTNYVLSEGFTSTALGILHYEDSSGEILGSEAESATQDVCVDPDPALLHPLPDVSVPSVSPEQTYTVSFTFLQSGPLQRIFFNQTSWVPLVGDATFFESQRGIQEGSIVQGNVTVNWPSSQFVVPIVNASVAQLIINSNSNDPHPFHLHGHAFYILGTGPGVYDSSIPLNETNPPQRDTAIIPPSGWIVIRWVADNPGNWIIHCHFSWHLSAGLLMQFAEDVNSIPQLKIPEETGEVMQRQCKTIREQFGKNVTVTGAG